MTTETLNQTSSNQAREQPTNQSADYISMIVHKNGREALETMKKSFAQICCDFVASARCVKQKRHHQNSEHNQQEQQQQTNATYQDDQQIVLSKSLVCIRDVLALNIRGLQEAGVSNEVIISIVMEVINKLLYWGSMQGDYTVCTGGTNQRDIPTTLRKDARRNSFSVSSIINQPQHQQQEPKQEHHTQGNAAKVFLHSIQGRKIVRPRSVSPHPFNINDMSAIPANQNECIEDKDRFVMPPPLTKHMRTASGVLRQSITSQ